MYALSSSRSLALLPFSLFLSSTCERLRHCRDDEKHWNDKSADTIDVTCSLRRYESIPFAGATQIMRIGGYKFTQLCTTDETFFCGQIEFNDTRDIRILSSSSSFPFLPRFNLVAFRDKIPLRSVLVRENTDINCTVNSVKLETVQNCDSPGDESKEAGRTKEQLFLSKEHAKE